jgi:hypothetical protein
MLQISDRKTTSLFHYFNSTSASLQREIYFHKLCQTRRLWKNYFQNALLLMFLMWF